MASDYWNQIDKDRILFKDHVCVFLDILGYKEKSEDFYSGKINLYGRINRALIQSGVEDNRNESSNGIYTQIFSDSIIIHTELNKLDLLLNYVATIVTYFSYEELFLRGGVSFGKYFDNYKENSNYSFFSSEALIKAYEIENKAIYPLIEIDKNLLNQIKNQEILCEFNNKPILNFARYIINEFGNNEDDVLKELNDIEVLLNNIREVKVKEKIQWLLNYYLWFLEVSNQKFKSFDLLKFKKFDIYKSSNFTFK